MNVCVMYAYGDDDYPNERVKAVGDNYSAEMLKRGVRNLTNYRQLVQIVVQIVVQMGVQMVMQMR
jgi:hypothetical protein